MVCQSMGKTSASSLKILGNKIKVARKSIGLSQRDLARYIKVSDKAVSSYEVGRSSPSVTVLKKISTIVHKPLSYFDEKAMLTREELMEKLKQIETELKEIKQYLNKKK
jgi:repressor LexA